jgi:beta-1,4-N-acetylgalactosaminyltransferase
MEKMIRKLIYKVGRVFIKDKEVREEWKKNIVYRRIGVDKIDKYCKGTPIEPWAFIRAKNEIITIDSCLKSILPVIKKGVIGYNDCNDGTEEYIIEFCKQNPGFIPVKYPYTVYPLTSNEYLKETSNKNCWFSSYCNYILSYIPKDEWIIKIDCDHIFDSNKLKKLLYLPKKDNDLIVISRLNLHIEKEKIYTLKNMEILEEPDHFIIKNKNLKFKMKFEQVNKKNIIYEEIEQLNPINYNFIYTEVTNYHFPTLKSYRKYIENDNKVLLEDYLKMKKKIFNSILDKKLVDRERILNIYRNFKI